MSPKEAQVSDVGVSLSKDQIDAIATALAGKLRTAAPAGPITGKACPVCAHVYTDPGDDRCPNNNCPRNVDPTVVGIHPATSEPMRDKEAHAAAMEAHKAKAAAA